MANEMGARTALRGVTLSNWCYVQLGDSLFDAQYYSVSNSQIWSAESHRTNGNNHPMRVDCSGVVSSVGNSLIALQGISGDKINGRPI